MKSMIFGSFDSFSEYCDILIEKCETEKLDECVFIVRDRRKQWYDCDLTTSCKSYKTAIRRFFKAISDYAKNESENAHYFKTVYDFDESVFSGWAECMLESCENGYFADNAPGSFAWGVEWVDEGRWYIFLNVKR